MLKAIGLLRGALEGVSFETFERDEVLQAATIRFLEVIGESARHLPEEVTTCMPHVPWADIIGMRNLLIHGYFEVDLAIVWKTATQAAPALEPDVKSALLSLGAE